MQLNDINSTKIRNYIKNAGSCKRAALNEEGDVSEMTLSGRLFQILQDETKKELLKQVVLAKGTETGMEFVVRGLRW